MEKLLKELYGISVINMQKSTLGAGSDTWFLECGDGKYVLKYPAHSAINHPESEPRLCEYLNEQGLPVCRFLKNKTGQYLSYDKEGRVFHVQEFFAGTVYEWNQAPDWLMQESARKLGRIHTVLKKYPQLPIGIGKDFFRCMTPEAAEKSYHDSLVTAEKRQDKEVADDLRYRIELIKRFPDFTFALEKLTCRNTHGDFFISQLICGRQEILAVIDWTTACVHPVIWEIARSYVYASPKCKDGNFDETDFGRYVEEYCKEAELNAYDKEMMLPLFAYQIAVCDYYGQYYASDAANGDIFLRQAKFSTKLLRTMDKNEILWRKTYV